MTQATRNITATELLVTLQNAPVRQPANYPNNPSNLLYQYQRDLGGNGTGISVEDAMRHWTSNPFILGSPQYLAFAAEVINRATRQTEKYLKIPDVPVIRAPSKRRQSQPRLKLSFDTLHDISMRVSGTVIFVGQQLFYVSGVYQAENDYLLVLEDATGKQYKTFYTSPDIDLRTPEPQYFSTETVPAFLLRVPYRQQRQGLSNETIQVKYVGDPIPHRGDIISLMRGITAESISWASNYYDLMAKAKAIRALRLSKDIAFNYEGELIAEYRGRRLGVVSEDVIIVDEDDFRRPWIRRDVQKIGCSMRVA